MSDKTLILLDASALKKSHCGLRLYYTIITGYRSPVVNNDITFGSAFHAYRKCWEETKDSHVSMVVASDYFAKTPCFVKKNKLHLTDTYLKKVILEYNMHWQFREDWETVSVNGTPLVELKFCLPYYVDDSVEVLICGTMDRIARNKNNPQMYAIADYKTTHVWNKQTYLEGFRLNPQLLFYVYTLQQLAAIGHDAEGCPIPYNFAKEITDATLGAFIDGIFLGGDKKETTFERSEYFIFSREDIQEFESELQTTCNKLVAHVKNKTLPNREGMVNGTCEGIFGACEYAIGCSAPTREIGREILENNFAKAQYNPMLFG